MFLRECTSRVPWLWGYNATVVHPSQDCSNHERLSFRRWGPYRVRIRSKSSQDAHHRRAQGLLLNFFELGHLAVTSRAFEWVCPWDSANTGLWGLRDCVRDIRATNSHNDKAKMRALRAKTDKASGLRPFVA